MGAGSRYREVHSRGVPEEHLFEPIRVLRRHGELLRGDGHVAVVDGERVVGARVKLRVRVRDGRRAVADSGKLRTRRNPTRGGPGFGALWILLDDEEMKAIREGPRVPSPSAVTNSYVRTHID